MRMSSPAPPPTSGTAAPSTPYAPRIISCWSPASASVRSTATRYGASGSGVRAAATSSPTRRGFSARPRASAAGDAADAVRERGRGVPGGRRDGGQRGLRPTQGLRGGDLAWGVGVRGGGVAATSPALVFRGGARHGPPIGTAGAELRQKRG